MKTMKTMKIINETIADLVSQLSLDEKIGLLPSAQQAIERLGIAECRFGTEVARGYVSRTPGEISTVFPQPIGLAATFDPDLMYKLGEICGTETRIYNSKRPYEALMVWGPTVDLCRDPRWGRNEESYGEDPFLTGEMSTAYCRGMRGEHPEYLRVLCGLKHFCCNNHEEDRLRDSANVDARLLREYYYAAFEPAIRAGAAHSLMTAYNELSGLPAIINPDVRRVCKEEWGMLFAVTDGGDFCGNVNAHKFSDSHTETLALALKAGINIITESSAVHATTIATAKAAIESGEISEEMLDSAISEVLTGRFMLGEFSPSESNPYANIPEEKLNCDEFKAVNARAARECITLLKNESGTLPIKDDGKCTVAVVGLHGDTVFKDWYTGMSDYSSTILSGLREVLGAERVTYHDACDIVAIKSVFNGRYLSVKGDGSIVADSDEITPECRFKIIEWGHENSYADSSNCFVVFVSEHNGKLLRCSEADDGVIVSDAPAGYVNAAGESTYEWFGRMIFRYSLEYKMQTLKSWRGKDIAVDSGGRLCEFEPGGIASAKGFKVKILSDGMEAAAELAANADYAVVCVGNDPMVSARECADRKRLALSELQQTLISNMRYKKNDKNIVTVVTSSYPYSILFEDNLPAIIHTAHGGPESGRAMADVLLGRYNPAGRLPQTWYKRDRDLPDIKNYDIAESGSTYLYFKGIPLYPFGHGLSYSKFEYSGFTVKQNGENIEIALKVTNVSEVYGEEVVQIYFTALNPRVKRPMKQLCEFIRQGIEPGETVDVTFEFSIERLRFWDVSRHKFAVESGEYRFCAAASSSDVRCTADIRVEGEEVPLRNLCEITAAVDYEAKRSIVIRYDKNREGYYVHAPQWNGAVDYYGVDFSGVKGIEVAASMDVSVGKIGVFIDDVQAGEIEVPACACPTAFAKLCCDFEQVSLKSGKLTLKLSQYVNLLEIRLV
ncbi:MAG: glycoside hydrolase family 3 C-terminal domain-containing protein [Oscillospiraceae bacterium]|nr:glycoside hydrolase family 3 C-terminal domain-containing protein [Oscillospiraceae bacterium]